MIVQFIVAGVIMLVYVMFKLQQVYKRGWKRGWEHAMGETHNRKELDDSFAEDAWKHRNE